MTPITAGFPEGFLWGASTASFVVEGAWDEDGRSPSIWDTFCHTPGKIASGDTCDVTCDHYHRWRDDVELMKVLELGAYHFSTSWSRILPEGTGRVNQQGLDFYQRLVDALLEAGIVPVLTLYHWDLPQILQDRGGWANRDTVAAFVEYADLMARTFADRIPLWVTHNEPSVVATAGHALGTHAPGAADFKLSRQVAHHLLLAHGSAVPVLRAAGVNKVGISLILSPSVPATGSPADVAAARRSHDRQNTWFLDPIFRSGYPHELWDWYEARGVAPRVEPGDMAAIAAPIDFLGVNYYTRWTIAHDPAGGPLEIRQIRPAADTSVMGWEVHPDGLHEILTWVSAEYGPREIYVTESGIAVPDEVAPDGAVHDRARTDYLASSFAAARRSIASGVPLGGYLVWSLMDTFEPGYGFDKRFGLVRVDFATLERTIKDSGWYVRDVARANALPPRSGDRPSTADHTAP